MKTTLAALLCSALGIVSASAFTVNLGSVSEITSPDDLLLDPSTSVIAVNVVSSADLLVNGVNFQNDGALPNTSTTTNGGFSVTTTRTGPGGEIPGWAAAPAFTGGTPGSAANLGTVMQSIRWAQGWNAGPTGIELLVDVAGLTSGTIYDVQLLFNEGPSGGDRRFDIGVEGALAVDDFSSVGGNGTYSASNSFAYQFQIDPGADGIINIALNADLGGDPFSGLDGNPILGAVIVHEVIPEPSSSLLVGLAAGVLLFRRRRR